MQSAPSIKFAFRRPSGIIAGLTASWAIFGFILAIDSELNLPPGTFYKMIGIVFGANSSYALYVYDYYKISFIVDDILNSTIKDKSFDNVFDRGCFHVLPIEKRPVYIREINRILDDNGILFLKCFSTKEPR